MATEKFAELLKVHRAKNVACLYSKNDFANQMQNICQTFTEVREAAKKSLFLVARPLGLRKITFFATSLIKPKIARVNYFLYNLQP